MVLKRMWDPVQADICECHFCGKKMKFLHKYVQLAPESGFTMTYLAHTACFGMYLFEFPEKVASSEIYYYDKWGPSKRRA